MGKTVNDQSSCWSCGSSVLKIEKWNMMIIRRHRNLLGFLLLLLSVPQRFCRSALKSQEQLRDTWFYHPGMELWVGRCLFYIFFSKSRFFYYWLRELRHLFTTLFFNHTSASAVHTRCAIKTYWVSPNWLKEWKPSIVERVSLKWTLSCRISPFCANWHAHVSHWVTGKEFKTILK